MLHAGSIAERRS